MKALGVGGGLRVDGSFEGGGGLRVDGSFEGGGGLRVDGSFEGGCGLERSWWGFVGRNWGLGGRGGLWGKGRI